MDSELHDALVGVENALNLMGGERAKQAAVRQWFGRMHRTLQQQFVKRVVLPILQQLAEAHRHGHTDLRNEAAAALAHKMLSAVADEDLYLPLV